MAKLNRQEILDFEVAILATFKAQMTVRANYPLAKRIKFPGIPSVFSESIVLCAADKLFPKYSAYIASSGGTLADITLSPPHSGALLPLTAQSSPMTVEVKATASRGTLELKTRDVQADFLVWLAFGNRFEGGSDPIHVHVVPNPKTNSSLQKVAGRIVKLPAFINAAQISPEYLTQAHHCLSSLI